jgi:hypothetical protein
MRSKFHKILFFMLLTTYNDAEAQTKLPNSVMYELIDCANNHTAFNKYLELHLLSNMANKVSYFKFEPKNNMQQYSRETDSVNKITLGIILDTLRYYNITRNDLLHERFYWLYKSYGEYEHRKSGKNHFTFQKSGKTIHISFGDLGISQGEWILAEPIGISTGKSEKEKPLISVSSTIKEEPLERGKYFEKLLREGKLDELFQNFYDKLADEALKKDNPSRYAEIMERMQEEKSEVRKCFQGLKPNGYKVKLIYMRWERETNRLKESDRGLYQFALIRENKETDLNFKYYPVEDHIYLGEFESVEVPPVLK